MTGNLHPDYRRVARFRQKNPEAIKQLLKETINLYQLIGYIFEGTIIADGTKIYANASDRKAIREGGIKGLEKIAEEVIKEEEERDAGEEEGGELKRGGIREEDFKKLKEKIEKVKEALKGSNQRVVSLTDKDARFMRHRWGHGIHLSYNGQLSVDEKGINTYGGKGRD